MTLAEAVAALATTPPVQTNKSQFKGSNAIGQQSAAEQLFNTMLSIWNTITATILNWAQKLKRVAVGASEGEAMPLQLLLLVVTIAGCAWKWVSNEFMTQQQNHFFFLLSGFSSVKYICLYICVYLKC